MTTGILIVDPQNDFYPGGALGVPDGDKINEPILRLCQTIWSGPVFVSRDQHPETTRHFKSGGGLWPPHCVRGTHGAIFHQDLLPLIESRGIVYDKGEHPDDDGGYSAFDGRRRCGFFYTNLLEDIHNCMLDTLIVAGLATDYCVKASALDARRYGLNVFLFTPGVRGVNIKPDDSDNAIAEMRAAGVFLLE